MTAWERKELQEWAALLADLLRCYEQYAPYEEYCWAKRHLRRLMEDDTYLILRRLLHERGIEL